MNDNQDEIAFMHRDDVVRFVALEEMSLALISILGQFTITHTGAKHASMIERLIAKRDLLEKAHTQTRRFAELGPQRSRGPTEQTKSPPSQLSAETCLFEGKGDAAAALHADPAPAGD